MSLSVFSDEGRQLAVAYTFERWARHLLHATLPSQDEWFAEKGLSHFDLDHEGLNVMVEIKGASNMDQLKLFDSQLDSQLSELGFPVDRGLVWIFSYKNCNYSSANGVEVRERLLGKQRRSLKELESFLAQHTNVAYVIDLHLLAAWREKYGTRRYARDRFSPRQCVRINRTDFRELAQNTRMNLTELGFGKELNRWVPHNAHHIKSRQIKTKIDGVNLDFELVPILPIRFRIDFLKQLKGSVHRM